MTAWKKIKNGSEITIPGIAVEMDVRDKALHGITLRDAAGNAVRIALESYSMYAYIPQPPDKVKRHRVEGTAAGLPVKEDFESRWEADQRVSDLESKTVSDTSLKVEEIETEVPF